MLAAFMDFVDPNPNPGNQFGHSVVALSTGNVVITAPYDDAGGAGAGAVYMFNGATGALISTLRGSQTNANVGYGGITALSNGNYVVSSPGTSLGAGAVTWGSGTNGVTGVVSAANSLVGNANYDNVGYGGITALSNGNYVVSSPRWQSNLATSVGAVTWGNGTTGTTGVVSASNSIVGTTGSSVGSGGITELSNGNYVVSSPNWSSGSQVGAVTWINGTTGLTGVVSSANSLVGGGAKSVTALSIGNFVVTSVDWHNGTAQVGAVTWGSGTTGVTGFVNEANSLVGNSTFNAVGSNGVTELSNGNYVVSSRLGGPAGSAGAVTWGSGTIGVKGVVSSMNSLVGSPAFPKVGNGKVTALSNGNYVVTTPGVAARSGAVTWGRGTTGVTGVVTSANSLVGNSEFDNVSYDGITELSNGNYVVRSPYWNSGSVTSVGAVTWVSGTTGLTGFVSAANSLVGTTAFDHVGLNGITALSNGNYVVSSPDWNKGTVPDVGAVTWVNGTASTTGVVSESNSLIGSTAADRIGNAGLTALSNGNYIVVSPQWDSGTAADAGAVTWGNGTTGITGIVSEVNSLVGSRANDRVGAKPLKNGFYVGNITSLSNGNYVVNSYLWDNGPVIDAGAVTWGSGTTGVIGAVSASNSLVGATPSDNIGIGGITALNNGNYVVSSYLWDKGTVVDAGAVTWGCGTIGVSGFVSATNSLVGSTAFDFIGAEKPQFANGFSYVTRP